MKEIGFDWTNWGWWIINFKVSPLFWLNLLPVVDLTFTKMQCKYKVHMFVWPIMKEAKCLDMIPIIHLYWWMWMNEITYVWFLVRLLNLDLHIFLHLLFQKSKTMQLYYILEHFQLQYRYLTQCWLGIFYAEPI